MVSGQGYNTQSQTNIATTSCLTCGRQTGSTFKVITLASALENGYSPNDIVNGSDPCPVPGVFPDVPPSEYPTNSDGREGGPQTIASATQNSVNCAFVRLATSVGYDKVITTAHAMGIKKNNLEPILNLTLGTREQNTETMATVMATIASGGVHHDPYVVQKIVAPDGKVILDASNHPGDQAVPVDVANCEQNVLRDVVTGGTGTNASVNGQEIFGKTGTTDDTTDAWFIGANPAGAGMQLATAVWFGNFRGNISGAGYGGDSAAPVFQAFMSQALADQPEATLPNPGPVCARSASTVNENGGRGGLVLPPAVVSPDLPTVAPTTPTVAPATTPTAPATTAPATTPTAPPVSTPANQGTGQGGSGP
jgi:penicillin-binding protein 1A